MGNLATTNYWNYKYDIGSIQDVINEYLEQDCKTTSNLCRTERRPRVKRAIFNPPATVILWDDGTKSVVKCQNGEPFDAEKGFVMAYLKKLLGNDNTFNKEITRWVDYEEPVDAEESNTEEVESGRKKNIKFNSGDRARIVGNSTCHQFELGTIVKLEKHEYDYRATSDSGEYWWVVDDDLAPVEAKDCVEKHCDTNEPLTTEELMKMDGERVWLSSIMDGLENFTDEYCGWHTVNVSKGRLDECGSDTWYLFSSNGTPHGFRAYRRPPKQAEEN